VRGQARKLAVLLASASAATVLSGCVAINGTSTSQPSSLGDLQLTITACAHGSLGCADNSNTGNVFEPVETNSIDSQLMLAVRLPNGSTPPDAFQATLSKGGPLAFSRSPGYEGELEALEPAPAGERWWGWISTKFTYSQAAAQSLTAKLAATLPRPADGGPLESPMHWRPVLGVRIVEAGLAASRPVDCGTSNEDLYEGFNEVGVTLSVTCIDSTGAEATRGFLTAPLIDFGIVGTDIQAAPGSITTGAFVARRSGAADPGTTFSLAALTGVPGGTVSIDTTTVSLGGDATQPVLASIEVPAGTRAGSYPVTLTATAPGKPTRTGTINVTVTSRIPRIRSASLSHKRFRAGKRGRKAGKGGPPVGTKLTVDLSEAAELSIEVAKLGGKRPKRLGTFRRSLPKGKSTIPIRGRLGKIRLTPGRYRLTLTARGDAGQASEPKRLGFTLVAG
jgi:hypothetical protein